MRREIPKHLLGLILTPGVMLHVAKYRILRRWLSEDRAFELCSEAIAGMSGLRGIVFRRLYYARTLPQCGRNCTFSYGVILTKAGIRVGNDVAIGLGSMISAADIGDDVLVGPGVLFLSGKEQHGTTRRDVPMSDQPGIYRTVRVGNDCWIGAGAVILADIGSGAVVAAGSVVVEPVPPYAIVAGNPARVVSRRPG